MRAPGWNGSAGPGSAGLIADSGILRVILPQFCLWVEEVLAFGSQTREL